MARTWIVPKGLQPEFYHDGNFVFCALRRGNRTESFAFAKRNPKLDSYDPELGETIALRRAVKKISPSAKKGK